MRRQRGRAVFRVLLLIVALGAVLRPVMASASPPEYREALGETLAAAEQAARTPGLRSLADSPRLAAALDRRAAFEAVEVDGDTRLEVDNRALMGQLRGDRDEGLVAIATLRALLSAVDEAAEPAPSAGRADAAGKLAAVLARREFRAGTNPVAQFLDDLRQRLFHWLRGFIPGLDSPIWQGGGLGQAAARAVEALLWALACFALAFFAFWWWQARRSIARSAALGAPVSHATPENAGAARLAAERAAAAGDFRAAMHFLYLWAMLNLAAQSRLSFDRALTNHEQLRALRGDGELANRLSPVVGAFDRFWYGYAPCGQAEYGQFRGAIERLVEGEP